MPKYHERIEAYGTIDELISWIGLLRSMDINRERSIILYSIQDKLMHSAAVLSAGPGADTSKMQPPDSEDIKALEAEIDAMDKELPVLTSFVLPGGNREISFTHISRSICRRAERLVIALPDKNEYDERVIRYLNRLSDYLFMLARMVAKESGIEQSKWMP